MASELGVQTIQHTNGTDALTIDASGNVTAKQDLTIDGNLLTPARPMFNVRGAGGAESATNVMDYSNTGGYYFNVGSHYDTTNKKFVAPVGGYYFFQVSFYSNNGSTSTVKMAVNGNTGSGYANTFNVTGSPGGYHMYNYCTFLNLSANDEIQVYVTNGSVYLDADANFAGFLIG